MLAIVEGYAHRFVIETPGAAGGLFPCLDHRHWNTLISEMRTRG
jgi:hypothetical protein